MEEEGTMETFLPPTQVLIEVLEVQEFSKYGLHSKGLLRYIKCTTVLGILKLVVSSFHNNHVSHFLGGSLNQLLLGVDWAWLIAMGGRNHQN